jgi:hypothetical protein
MQSDTFGPLTSVTLTESDQPSVIELYDNGVVRVDERLFLTKKAAYEHYSEVIAVLDRIGRR